MAQNHQLACTHVLTLDGTTAVRNLRKVVLHRQLVTDCHPVKKLNDLDCWDVRLLEAGHSILCDSSACLDMCCLLIHDVRTINLRSVPVLPLGRLFLCERSTFLII